MNSGDKAPDFILTASNGKEVSLDDFRGKNLVIFYYIKDDTPGWTTEANEFGELYEEFKEFDTEVLGVSPDNLQSHKKFVEKRSIPFLLLSDPDKELAEDYGALKEKGLLAKVGLNIERSTFVIDKEGILAKKYNDVKVKNHARDVLRFIKGHM